MRLKIKIPKTLVQKRIRQIGPNNLGCCGACNCCGGGGQDEGGGGGTIADCPFFVTAPAIYKMTLAGCTGSFASFNGVNLVPHENTCSWTLYYDNPVGAYIAMTIALGTLVTISMFSGSNGGQFVRSGITDLPFGSWVIPVSDNAGGELPASLLLESI